MRKLSLLIAVAALAALSQAKEAPVFKAAATDGKTYTQKSLGAKPTLVFFVNSKCPHSKMAVPDLNKLRKLLGAKVHLVGVTELKLDEAKKYAKEIKAEFPLVADPDKKILKGFGAKFSLDMTLVTGKAKPAFSKVWEGYSKDWVQEALNQIPTAQRPKLDLTFLPADRQSGCQF